MGVEFHHGQSDVRTLGEWCRPLPQAAAELGVGIDLSEQGMQNWGWEMDAVGPP